MGLLLGLLLVAAGFFTVYVILDCISGLENKNFRRTCHCFALFLLGAFVVVLLCGIVQGFFHLQIRFGCVLVGLLLAINVWGNRHKKNISDDTNGDTSDADISCCEENPQNIHKSGDTEIGTET